MAVIGLDHVQVAIPSGGEQQARVFYGEILGMEEVAKPTNLSPSGCWFTGGNCHLHVGVDPDFRPATKAHPAFLVDDLDAVKSALSAANYHVLSVKPLTGYCRFFTRDPFGNRIEIMQPSKAEPSSNS